MSKSIPEMPDPDSITRDPSKHDKRAIVFLTDCQWEGEPPLDKDGDAITSVLVVTIIPEVYYAHLKDFNRDQIGAIVTKVGVAVAQEQFDQELNDAQVKTVITQNGKWGAKTVFTNVLQEYVDTHGKDSIPKFAVLWPEMHDEIDEMMGDTPGEEVYEEWTGPIMPRKGKA